MKRVTSLLLLFVISSCAGTMTQHRMKAANRKLVEARDLQSHGQWAEALALVDGMHSSVAKSISEEPLRKNTSKAEVDLRPLLTAWESGALNELTAALKQQDASRSARAFTAMNQQCAICHLALGRADIKIAQ